MPKAHSGLTLESPSICTDACPKCSTYLVLAWFSSCIKTLDLFLLSTAPFSVAAKVIYALSIQMAEQSVPRPFYCTITGRTCLNPLMNFYMQNILVSNWRGQLTFVDPTVSDDETKPHILSTLAAFVAPRGLLPPVVLLERGHNMREITVSSQSPSRQRRE